MCAGIENNFGLSDMLCNIWRKYDTTITAKLFSELGAIVLCINCGVLLNLLFCIPLLSFNFDADPFYHSQKSSLVFTYLLHELQHYQFWLSAFCAKAIRRDNLQKKTSNPFSSSQKIDNEFVKDVVFYLSPPLQSGLKQIRRRHPEIYWNWFFLFGNDFGFLQFIMTFFIPNNSLLLPNNSNLQRLLLCFFGPTKFNTSNRDVCV